MSRWWAVGILLLLVACSRDAAAPTSSAGSTTTAWAAATTPTSTAPPSVPTTTAAATTTQPRPVAVDAPGTYVGAELGIRLTFRSEVEDVSSEEFASLALAILNDPWGWNQSGFTFIADDASALTVVLAEGSRVDALCLPLTTGGTASCQNGDVVALNADRWRSGADDWDATLDDYRTYLVNHEVGHLIGLRHPVDRCPTPEKISAAMEPQTNNLQGCQGNGIPLAWEIEWAAQRPVVVGPPPDWDGPHPTWPTQPDG